MKINQFTALVGSNLILVPYRESHVVQYHNFMSDPAIRESTASEELTLQEEYEMQASWRNDDDKLTFIILKHASTSSLTANDIAKLDTPNNMIGDVNLFISEVDDTDDESEEGTILNRKPSLACRKRAELELMIALTSVRRSGYGLQAIQLFLSYSSKALALPPSAFFAKIGVENEASIKLFEKLGFVKGKVSEVFQEVEMVCSGAEAGGEGWNWERSYEEIEYPE